MKIALGILGGFAALAIILALGLGLGWFGLIAGRPMVKYATETERQRYVNSVAHQQGADSGIGIDCANMRNVSAPLASRHAFAGLVVQDAAAYAGNADLSAQSRACVSDANDLLAQPLPTQGQ